MKPKFRLLTLLLATLGLLGASLGLALPARAQFTDSYNFLKAVRDSDAAKAKSLAEQPGSTIINARDLDTGELALHIVVKRRDYAWINFLVGMGANIEGRDRAGNTPLILAADLGFADGVRTLIAQGAKVNAANPSGETALIKAVQKRDIEIVRALLDNGANPDLTDNVVGLSARDYAVRDRRASAIVRMIDDLKNAKPAPKE